MRHLFRLISAVILILVGLSALNKKCSIGWTSVKHAGGAVPVYAIGVGAEKFNGRIDNTEIMGKILGESK